MGITAMHYFVIRGSRLDQRLANPVTNRHFGVYARNVRAALKEANKCRLNGEHFEVTGRCSF